MSYISSELIRQLREKRKMTQKELATKLCVSDKTVSKWETGKGLPDVGIIEELAVALGISVTDLFTGEYKENENISANMKKMHFYICPLCGNVVASIGAGSFNCCGFNLFEATPEIEADEAHTIHTEMIDGELFVSMQHEMTKKHFISFFAYVTGDEVTIKKLYPEQAVEGIFSKKGNGFIYAYCNRHGIFCVKI